MGKIEEKLKTFWDWLGWIILGYLFFHFVFGFFDNSSRIEDLEYQVQEQQSQIDNLDSEIDYINDWNVRLETYLKLQKSYDNIYSSFR